MPIRRDLRHFYGPEWQAARAQILERAGKRCEQCHKPNRQMVETVSFVNFAGDPFMLWRLPGQAWWVWHNGKCSAATATDEFFGGLSWRQDVYTVRVVLTVAHLNHTPGDDRPENLKALCQWCHLNYDKLHHKRSRAARKDRSRPLLGVA